MAARPFQRRRRRQRLASSDRGEATTQLVILTPILVVLIFLGVQAALYFHAANVAAAAAAEGSAAAAPVGSGAGAGADASQRVAAELGGTLAGAPSVVVDGGYVTVVVSIEVPRIVPFFPDTVSRSAVEPIERPVPEAER